MRAGFYPRLAWTGIRNNRKLYLPYLLTCIGMVMMYYIVSYLSASEEVFSLPGGWAVQSMLGMGAWIIAIFACLFLLYSNSFLMRRRRKEFGLYNVLGMGKWNLSLVLVCETLITFVLSMAAGLLAGAALSKAAELCLVNMMHGDISYRLRLSAHSITSAFTVFGAIFAVILLRSLWQVRKSSAIALLHSTNTGEKLPRLYMLWGVVGAILLAAAYYIAVSIKEPLSAMVIFFAAVAMVILATYLLFVSGSVLLCKLLQKNKRYYYKANHFVSVSSMAYRMTRNGAGLASICILLTMVLVMLSSTSCLYFGAEDSLRTRYPRDFVSDIYLKDMTSADDGTVQTIRTSADKVLEKYGVQKENVLDYRYASVSGMLTGNELETDPTKLVVTSLDVYNNLRLINFIPVDDYNALSGRNVSLAPDEVLVYSFRRMFDADTFAIRGGAEYKVKEHLAEFPVNAAAAMDIVSTMFIVVPDFDSCLESIAAYSGDGILTINGVQSFSFNWFYGFDLDADNDTQIAIYRELEDNDVPYFESRAFNRNDFFGTYAGLFALGLVLSAVFLFAAVLIIYYKQVTEGYEDQARFDIMRKVGMTKRDIRKSINSQMLTVFLMPLLTAGLHLVFAFPIVRKLLLLFNMNNVNLFIITTLISFLVFGVFYVIVYKITSNAYYDIVSGAKAND
jgi:putative ABC transport system permease protein